MDVLGRSDPKSWHHGLVSESKQDEVEPVEPVDQAAEPVEDPAKPAGADPIDVLHQRIAELERQLSETAQLRERIAGLEERNLGFSLEGIKEQLGGVEDRMNSVESKRDAWARTLLLTIAAPLAAGVFGQFTKMRDVQLKRFEQNLQLVDRALDFEKGEAYREGVLEYIEDLNEDEDPVSIWAQDQLDALEVQIDSVRDIAKDKKKEVDTKKDRIKKKNREIEDLKRDVEKVTVAANADPTMLRDLDDTLTKLEQTRNEAEVLQAEVEVEAEEASELAQRAGQAPVSSTGVTVTQAAQALPVEDTPEQYFIQVASFSLDNPKLAKERISALDEAGLEAVLLTRAPYFVVMVGPFDSDVKAESILDEYETKFDGGSKIRRLDKFCPAHVRVKDGLLCPSTTPKPEQSVAG